MRPAYGYEITARDTSGFFSKKVILRTRGVVFSAGVLGTVHLMSACRDHGSLPRLSDALGTYVRTNSESIQGVVVPDRDISRGLAITSGGFTPNGTHIEIVRYGDKADSMGMLSTVHTPGGRLPRQL